MGCGSSVHHCRISSRKCQVSRLRAPPESSAHTPCPSAPTLSVFQPGSSSPAAILYDAMEQFDRKSPKADEAVRSIKTDLADAVDTCVEAAGMEMDATWQKKLLKVSAIQCRREGTSGSTVPSFVFGRARQRPLGERSWTCTILQI